MLRKRILTFIKSDANSLCLNNCGNGVVARSIRQSHDLLPCQPFHKVWRSYAVLRCNNGQYKSYLTNQSSRNFSGSTYRPYQRYSWGRGREKYYERFDAQPEGGHRQYLSRRNRIILVVTGVGGMMVWISSRQEVPYTGRHHSILVNVETERVLGEQTFRQVLMDAQGRGVLLSPRHPASRMVRRVGERIAAVAGDGFGGGYQEQMKGVKWEFAVIKSPEVNAFVVPGGKVVVYSGLLNMVSSEDELAAVLAHEVAHILARHAAERMTQGSLIELLRMVAYIGFGIPLLSGPLQALFFLPNSRSAETEADTIGVQLAARACYSPEAAVTMFEKMGKAEVKAGVAIPKFLRTHPVSEDRVQNIKKLIPKASMLSESNGCRPAMRDFLIDFEERLAGGSRH